MGSSEPQREGVLFGRADEDGDGLLTESELRRVFLDFDTNSKPYLLYVQNAFFFFFFVFAPSFKLALYSCKGEVCSSHQ